MDLSQLNMEYIELENVHMDNVVLPFSQIPYIFGGVDYIKNTSDNISLTGDGLYRITKEEYLSEGIKLLCDYYEIQECHFPLANIYLSLADISKAYEHLKLGMQQCVIMKDFRILKYFCKLAAKSDMFSYKQLSSMYTIIQKYLPVDSLNKEQMHNYSKHIGEIKTILFSKHNMPRMTFTIKTNIEPDNVQVLSKLLESIFLFKSKICNMGHTSQVILAQNSPFIVTVDVTDQLQNLCSFAMLLISLVSETDMLYQLYADCIDSSNCIEKSELKSINSSLLKIANEQNKYYREKKVILSVDEILFYNIKQNLKKNLQYFNPNRTQGFSLRGE